MLLPILFLGAAALLLVNRSKVADLYRSKIAKDDLLSYGLAFAGTDVGAPATLSDQGLAKVKSKLERQTTNLDEPLALLTLANIEQAVFYGLEAGSSKPVPKSAHRVICDSLRAASDELGLEPVLFISPRSLSSDGVEWIGGFVITTGEPSEEDFGAGGALEGCIRVGDYESLKSAKFC
jgi:hypothetical protein